MTEMTATTASTNALTPLVVDLDGTLTPTDTLWESLVRAIKTQPWIVLLLPFWLLTGRAAFKKRVSNATTWSGQGVPLRPDLLQYLKDQHQAGRKLVLATAADMRIARTVAADAGLFDDVIASENGDNLKGARKLEGIRARLGEAFAYAGDHRVDAPIWQAARGAVLVGSVSRLRSLVGQTPVEAEFPSCPAGLMTWLRGMRLHQWMKNALIFVPLLTSFSLSNGSRVLASITAFLAFGLCASATYIVNDLCDLDSDRAHARKSKRPFASCAILIPHALAAALLLMVVGLGMAVAAGTAFALVLLSYVVLTSAYSWWLKRFVVADVLVLACLYTERILAGAVVIHVKLSSWLLAFSIFIFLSLALVKRCTELVSLSRAGMPGAKGRNYNVVDLAVLWPAGVSAGMASVVVFGLFINSPETLAQYATPQLLWLVGLGLIYWVTRLWIKTGRSEMHDDPLVFTLRDLNSRMCVALMLACTLAARFLTIPS